MSCLQHLQQEKVVSRIKTKQMKREGRKEGRKEGEKNEKRCAKQKEI